MVVQNTMTSNTSFNNNIIKDLIINNYLNLNPDEGSWDINHYDFISDVDIASIFIELSANVLNIF